jgi:anti-sigma B factor antagonist
VSFELSTSSSPPGAGPEIPVVRVRGEIDVTNASGLREALAGLVTGGLIIDLSSVSYFDSAGFAVLDRLIAQAPVAVVVPPGSVVRTAMSLLNLPFYASVDAARAALGG